MLTPEPVELQVNVPLLRKTLEHITAHPEEWDQGSWAVKTGCGTVYCLAGHAVTLQGLELEWDCCGEKGCTVCVTLGPEAIASECRTPDGELVSIEEQARRDLGLTEEQAAELFFSLSSLRNLWNLASRYTGGEIQPPADLPG